MDQWNNFISAGEKILKTIMDSRRYNKYLNFNDMNYKIFLQLC